MADPDTTRPGSPEETTEPTDIDLGPPETDAREAVSLKEIAERCEAHIEKLLKAEQAEDDVVRVTQGHWASRQYAEFNLWCAKVGVHGEGFRSIDVRLKDVPEICELLRPLLKTLEWELHELVQPAVQFEQRAASLDDTGDEDDVKSGTSSLSFDSLSSAEQSDGSINSDFSNLASRKQRTSLQAHIEDTIDRLHGHALRIDDAGANHRRRRVELYRDKPGPRAAYEMFKALALHKARLQFKQAPEFFLQRLAESFARRRSRLEYLRQHQKKRAIDVTIADQPLIPQPEAAPDAEVTEQGKKEEAPPSIAKATATVRPQDQRTVLSATVFTTLEATSPPPRPERAESVASVALRNDEFPPPPRCIDGKFECPYCRLEFRSREAEKGRWSQHVMTDFEPYFCIWEHCETPFDVPPSFEGLLRHMQSHVNMQYHVDMPDGTHKAFDEKGFERHMTQGSDASRAELDVLKEASRRKAAFMLETCPFCGGFPDDVEKRFPDRDTPECQSELRRHVKKHMQDAALFLPPYRDDVSEVEDLESSAFSGLKSAGQRAIEAPSDFVDDCGRADCDCSNQGTLLGVLHDIPDPPVGPIWADLFGPDHPQHDRSPVPDSYFEGDDKLKPFVQRLERDIHRQWNDLSALQDAYAAVWESEKRLKAKFMELEEENSRLRREAKEDENRWRDLHEEIRTVKADRDKYDDDRKLLAEENFYLKRKNDALNTELEEYISLAHELRCKLNESPVPEAMSMTPRGDAVSLKMKRRDGIRKKREEKDAEKEKRRLSKRFDLNKGETSKGEGNDEDHHPVADVSADVKVAPEQDLKSLREILDVTGELPREDIEEAPISEVEDSGHLEEHLDFTTLFSEAQPSEGQDNGLKPTPDT